MLSIRLSRFGKKKQPSYRVIVCQKHKDPLGDYIESIGHINYYGGQKNITLDLERAKYWISVGAQPTGTVHNLLVEEGVIKGKKQRPYGTRKVVKEEKEEKPEEKEGDKKEEGKVASDEVAPKETPVEEEKPEEKVEEKKEVKD
ncbi:MAG: 30S ribosomal protein S16, partial [Proteobacteria bacterium]|nr:30S ribosomal protein S16 [Pseudomonadota bacterium]